MKQSKRKYILLNRQWKFVYGDAAEAKESEFDDSGWYDIGLPHSFGIPYFMENEFYVGYGCYRKHLYVEKEWLGKCVSLEFQGVFQTTQVYVNGMLAGEHKGGYTAFQIPVSLFLREGDNVIFVRVNNLWDARIAPRAGEHVFNGGIYRDVSLIVTEPVHVAWYGTFVKTPKVSKQEALIRLETEVVNESSQPVQVKLVSRLEEAGKGSAQPMQAEWLVSQEKEGEGLLSFSSERLLAPGEAAVLVQEGILGNPKLWHPDTPELYHFQSELYTGEGLADEYGTEFGIRWFAFTPDRGFFLNGEHYRIHGANVHQDHAGWSDAVPHTGIERDVGMIKDCGMNFIRGSHYPHHTYFADVCDRLGILFWSENCFWGTGGPNEDGYWTASAYPVKEEDEEAFEASCAQTLTEMIRTNRNHPSIIVWSMCNEPFFSDIRVMDKAKELIRKLVRLTHELDPGRPAAVGGVQRGGFDRLGDLAGYNGDGATIFMDPGIPNFVSEYGSVVSDRPGKYAGGLRDGVEVEYVWRSGIARWCAFHHGSIFGDMGHMGMVDYYRLPLNAWYWYRKELLGMEPPERVSEGKPAGLTLTADREIISSDGTEDAHVVVTVTDENGRRVNAAPDILLEVVSGGGIFPTGKAFCFSAERGNLAEGMGAIEMRSYYAGEVLLRASAEGLTFAEIIIQVTGEEMWQGQELNLPQSPPERMGMPVRDHLNDIGRNRPVFFSSAREDSPARNIVDGEYGTCWQADREEPGEWVMVDLEGSKEVAEVGIVFPRVAKVAYVVELSDDQKQYETVYLSREDDCNSFVTLPLERRKTRYIRIRFPGKPVAVACVSVNA